MHIVCSNCVVYRVLATWIKRVKIRERPMYILDIGTSEYRHPLRTSVNRCLRSADTDSKKKLRMALWRAESTCDC